MAFSFLYLAVRALLGTLVRSRRGLDVKDIELLVLVGAGNSGSRSLSRKCLGFAAGVRPAVRVVLLRRPRSRSWTSSSGTR